MAVADVPGARLALRGREGEGATLSECLAVCCRACHHGIVLGGVVCHHFGDHLCFGHGRLSFELRSVYRVGRSDRGQLGTLPRPSHHIETVLLIVGGVVGAPVGETCHEGLIIRAVVEFDQPLGDGAVLCFEHGEQGSDDT